MVLRPAMAMMDRGRASRALAVLVYSVCYWRLMMDERASLMSFRWDPEAAALVMGVLKSISNICAVVGTRSATNPIQPQGVDVAEAALSHQTYLQIHFLRFLYNFYPSLQLHTPEAPFCTP